MKHWAYFALQAAAIDFGKAEQPKHRRELSEMLAKIALAVRAAETVDAGKMSPTDELPYFQAIKA